ncbi:a-factor receptor [Trapelia coarctata]|nr:a-factor receptor [Trapelia coarctata]
MANTTPTMDTFAPMLGVSPGAIAVPLLSFIALFLSIPTFAWHVKNRSIAGSALVFWIILANLMNIINALIWPTDDIPSWYQGQGLCDIEVKLELAQTLGLVGSIACIMKALARALDTNQAVVHLTPAERQRRNFLDWLLCFGPAVYMMLVHYIVQFNRYYVFAIAGCTPSVDNSWPSIALLYIWPPVLCLLDGYYAIIILHRMRIYRRDFSHILRATSSGLNKSRFFRLFALAMILLVIILPVQFYILYQNTSFPLQPYSWTRVHGPDWDSVILIPTLGAVIFDRWIRIALGFIVFACFGIGGEATKLYKSWLVAVGLGYIFPVLNRPAQSLPTHRVNSNPTRSSSETSRLGSLSTKAKLIFARKFSRSSAASSTVASSPVLGGEQSPIGSQFPVMSATYTYQEKNEQTNWLKRALAFVRRGAPRYLVWGRRESGNGSV